MPDHAYFYSLGCTYTLLWGKVNIISRITKKYLYIIMIVLGELISFYLPALLEWVDSGLQGKGRLHKSPGKCHLTVNDKVKRHTTFVYQQTLQLHA